MGCCCISDATVSNRSRSISNERIAADHKASIVKNAKESMNINNVNSNTDSFSQVIFETMPYFDEFDRVFQDFVGRPKANYNNSKHRLIDFSNKWGALLARIQKALARPSENKLKELFSSRILQVSRISKYREKSMVNKAEIPNKSNSIIDEKEEYQQEENEIEIDNKENSSKDSSLCKQSAIERVPDFAGLNREKFIIFINKAKFFENTTRMEHPHVQIKVKPDQNNKEIVTVFETKKEKMRPVPEWNEGFSKEFEFGKKNDLNKAVFIVELLYFDSKSQLLNSLGENTFTFDEIKSQMVTTKVIKYTKFDKIIAELFIKCQFIYDYKELLKYWESLVKVKKEYTDRLITRWQPAHSEGDEERKAMQPGRFHTEENGVVMEINDDSIPVKKSNEFSKDKDNSILSMDEHSLAQSGYFDNQYYVKN